MNIGGAMKACLGLAAYDGIYRGSKTEYIGSFSAFGKILFM